MLDAIGAGLAPRVGDRDWKDVWLDSPEYQTMRQEIETLKQQGLAIPVQERHSEAACKLLIPYYVYDTRLTRVT